MTRRSLLRILLVAAALLAAATAPQAAHAAEPPSPAPRVERKSLPGFDTVRRVGGPDSVQSALIHHGQEKDALFYRFHLLKNALRPWYDFKRTLLERHGLAIGLDYNALYQVATESLGERQTAGGVFRLYGIWTFLGRGTKTHSDFVFRVENRHALGTTVAPSKFGKEIGALLPTANSFADFGWALTNLQWQQAFQDGRFRFALGQIDVRDWLDPFPLSNWRTALLGAAVTWPVTPLPPESLGAAAFACFRERNTVCVLAGLCDANAQHGEVFASSFFDQMEYYSFVQVGWSPSFERMSDDVVRITYWHQDARTEAQVPEGWGLAFTAFRRLEKTWIPFLRGGYADGGVIAAKGAVVAGLGYERKSHDLIGAAIGWATPWEPGLRDQTTIEMFYRVQLSQHVGITPDLEILIHPSHNPAESVIVVFGIRMQIAF